MFWVIWFDSVQLSSDCGKPFHIFVPASSPIQLLHIEQVALQSQQRNLAVQIKQSEEVTFLNQFNLSDRTLVGMESMARQFSSSLSVFSLGHWLTSGAMTLI